MGPITQRPASHRRKSSILVTNELNEAIERCRNKVKSLAAECRANNRKFTDIAWDLSTDWRPCMYKLSGGDDESLAPTEVRRVTDIFEKPVFFDGGATASDIRQGGLGDCWFLSAMGVVAAAGLIEKICVERDEQVGIYGFIFWRDSGWVDVIIDDYLCTKVPRWEDLDGREQTIYRNSKEKYRKEARKGGHTLMFAKSDTENETWVPLLEKAYAKLHGDYESISGGFTGEGIEDLTGAVSTPIYLSDLLDPDRFWKEELMNIGIDRVFACSSYGSFETYDADGLVAGHAYALLKAVEHEGRRFVVVRNPWGDSEWKGRWSDGSKEWNDEFAVGLKKALGDFKFGDDGEFVQEYQDFLQVWKSVDRNRLFDESWTVNAQWLGFYPENHKTWSHGDITFTISVDGTTEAVICLAQMDPRYFQEQFGMYDYNLDFTVYKRGETIPFGRSTGNQYWRRSVKMQTVLEAGEYVVQVRIRRQKSRSTPYDFSEFDEDKLARKRTEWAMSKSIAVNFDPASTEHIRLPPGLFTGTTLLELQVDAQEQINALREKQQARKKANTEAREALAKQKAEEEAKKAEEEAKKAEEANGAAEGEGAEGEEKNAEEKTEEPVVEVQEPEVSGKATESEWVDEESGGSSEDEDKKKKSWKKKRPGFLNKAMAAAKRARFELGSFYGTEHAAEPQGEVDHEAAEEATSGAEDEGENGGSNSEDATPEVQVAVVVEEEEPEPHIFECTECTEQIKGILYHCMETGCISYNICDDCKKYDDHPAEHTFVKFTTAEDAQAIIDTNDDGGESELVLGLRVYTQRSVPATVRGHIRKGSILRQHYLKKR